MKEFSHPDGKQALTGLRLLAAFGFVFLSGLCGFGATWIVIGIIGSMRSKNNVDFFDFAAKCMPVLIAGGIVGLVVGLLVSLKVAKADPQTEEIIEKRFVGFRGRIKIYWGVPVFVIALISPFLESVLHKFGNETGAYVALGVMLAIIAASLFLYDHIPARLIIPFGIVGWLLTVLMIVWFGLLRPGAF